MKPIYPDGFLQRNLDNCRTKTKCEGECDVHGEGLHVCRVIDESGITPYDWGYFTYCMAAMESDHERGFRVLTEEMEGFEP